jgi:hypothetical protein
MALPPTTLPNTKDITQPIPTILDGSNYPAWSQNMSRWLEGHYLWEYVSGEKPKPVAGIAEPAAAFSTHLQIWKSIHYRIISWFSNTYVVSNSMIFGNLDNAKEVWDILAQRYNTTDLAQRFQIVTKLHQMRQEPGQSITEFYSLMTHLWNQLALCEPKWRDKDDASDYIAFRNSLCLAEFLTAIWDEFENTRASLLHRSPPPSLESAFSELISEETQFSTMKLHTLEMVMATASCNTRAPNSIPARSSSSNWNI